MLILDVELMKHRILINIKWMGHYNLDYTLDRDHIFRTKIAWKMFLIGMKI